MPTPPERDPQPSEETPAPPQLRAVAQHLLARLAAEAASARRPTATYRLQFNQGFRFEDGERLVPYLAALGVSDLYSSPYLKAQPGSNHGYDVLDHQQLNPEIGTAEDHARLCAALSARGLGHVLDIVPNHMGIGQDNALWRDLLENGPSSASARFFDVEWKPVKEELENKVLLPVLGDRYGAVLEQGELQLRREGGSFVIAYWEHAFPVNPRSYGQILSLRLGELEQELGHDPSLDELKSILSAIANMPARTEVAAPQVEERRREKEVVKRRLAQLFEQSAAIRDHVDRNVLLFNGTPGDPRSFDALEKLLAAQAYRLAHWRVSSEEINYRRFFDINTLAAIRVEDPVVFEEAHRLPLRLLQEGKLTGLRVDHPDGLAYPHRYFGALQEVYTLQRARALAQEEKVDAPWEELEPALREELGAQLRSQGARSPLFCPLFVVAEKILGRTEELPDAWQVRGTTGYDFLNSCGGIFVDRAAKDAFDRLYARFIGHRIEYRDCLYEKKKLILYSSLASEMNLLARQLSRISEADRWSRDFTHYSLRSALIEFVACFPVYRPYIDETGLDARDRGYIEQALALAKRRNPSVASSLYDFIGDLLLQRFAPRLSEEDRAARLRFAVKLQQVLGPVMAKGLEDTTFYIYNRLASLNEVGGEPEQFGVTVEAFHRQNQNRARRWSTTLNATATHDTKRGEDLRLRMHAISELSQEFRMGLAVWSRRTASFKDEIDGAAAPDRNEEYLFWQTLLGAWPLPAPGTDPLALPSSAQLTSLTERLQAYMVKASREAKLNTSWIQEEPRWEQAIRSFVARVLEQPAKAPFWRSFLPLARRIALLGACNSLSQLVLKLASPGVPDFYQGTELWDLSLVDPDNRRPVDFGLRQELLRELQQPQKPQAELAAELLAGWEDGRIKLWATQAGLRARREEADLFLKGDYRPLSPEGPRAEHLCAFARGHGRRLAVAAVPRLLGRLLEGELQSPKLQPGAFAGTVIPLPGVRPGELFVDVFTGAERKAVRAEGGAALRVDQAFDTVPFALLLRR